MENLELWFGILGVVFFAFSEVIGMVPKWKSNSVVQVILNVGGKLFKKKNAAAKN